MTQQTWQDYINSLTQYNPQAFGGNQGTAVTGAPATKAGAWKGVPYVWPTVQQPTKNDYSTWDKTKDYGITLGAGVGKSAGDLLVYELAKRWQDSGSKSNTLKSILQGDLVKNLETFTTNSEGQYGPAAAIGAQTHNKATDKTIDASALGNAANYAASQMETGGQGLARQMVQNANTTAGRAASEAQNTIKAQGGPVSAQTNAGAKIAGAINWGDLAASAMQQRLKGMQEGQEARAKAGSVMDQMAQTNYMINKKPWETRTDSSAAVSALNSGLAQQESFQNSTYIPSNPVTPLAQNVVDEKTQKMGLEQFAKYLRGES